MAAATHPSDSGSKIIQLPPRSEWRFELERGERIAIRLLGPYQGGGASSSSSKPDADIFGAEIAQGEDRWYTFGDEAKGAVTSWNGAALEMIGSVSTDYVADEPSPAFSAYANLHLLLEKRRLGARAELRANDASLAAALAEEELQRLSGKRPTSVLQDRDGLASEAHTEEGKPAAAVEGGAAGASAYRPEGQGPRVMVVGGEPAGKTSLVKLLANLALRSPAVCDIGRKRKQDGKENGALGGGGGGASRQEDEHAKQEAEDRQITGWWPVIVNLDPSEGAPPLPATLSAIPLQPIPLPLLPSASPALPFGTFPQTTGYLQSGSATAQAVSPLVLWLGRTSLRENELHARRLIEHLAEGTERRLARDPRARMSGLLIDMPGVTTADGRNKYSLLQHTIRTFKVDIVVVLGHEKLNIELSRAFPAGSSGVSIVKLPKSEGVVELDETYKERLRRAQVRNYFYGGGGSEADRTAFKSAEYGATGIGGKLGEPLGGVPVLNAFSTSIPLDLLEVYRIGQESMAPTSALPIGASRSVTAAQLVKLDQLNSTMDQSSLLHAVLALVQPPRGGGGPGKADSEVEPPPEDDEILGAQVLGFLHVADIDAQRKKMTVLSPLPGKLPSKTALLGTIDWQDV
ncbi:hypothetical protein K437DRAFT_259681 [Tilletiaria anomala UBC 951]|uniref:Polynucleotide 5'-hydroxyl-kinase GRC3 n=1 Tax=Tilletiaria anomala (strain ATCC 24038 / CBS 436.72 / UBC 951) TaxID=1037660 RepID=A0A066VGN9_TILAU|nr:uncharacterized protein K437DRAFT_259681 [Tilletiaria anomala UBC 951]KDN37750.1 hypothetical protein K437DRAFT_259681 [Tilletiaria anomala UBC 951]